MNHRTLYLTTILLGVGSSGCWAQGHRGDTEFGFMGVCSTTLGQERRSDGVLQASCSHYLTRALEVGLAPTLTLQSKTTSVAYSEQVPLHYYDVIKKREVFSTTTVTRHRDEVHTDTTVGAALFVNWNFGDGGKALVPYAGCMYSKSDLGNADDKGLIGLHVGEKMYLGPRIAFKLQVSYLRPAGGGGAGSGTLMTMMGLSCLF